MKRTFTIQSRILTAFAVGAVVVAAIVAISSVGIQRLRGLQDEGAARAAAAVEIRDLAALGTDLFRVIADHEVNLDFDVAGKEWPEVKNRGAAIFKKAADLVDTPEERSHLDRARQAFDHIVVLYEQQMLPTLNAGSASAETQGVHLEIGVDVVQMSQEAKAISQSLALESEKADQEFDRMGSATLAWAIGVGVLGLAGLAVFLGFILRSVSRALRTIASSIGQSAEQVTSASSQVATSSQSLSQGATEQAASLEESSASIEEMASMARRNSENSQAAADLARDTNTAVSESNRALHDLQQAMTGIRESSSRIGKIIKTIDEIAFQTNILALNAAVEAARAGEAGMGFAVVADEVRSLAQRSAQAAQDTTGLIEEAIGRAKAGNAQVDQMSAVITAITDKANRVKSLVDEITASSRQQTQGIEQVAQAIAQMEKVTQTTAASAEEGAAASEELSAQAEETLSSVRELEALVGAAATPAA